MTRICITGGPRTGKTTLAKQLTRDRLDVADRAGCPGPTLRHTDDLIGTHDWSSASHQVTEWLDEEGPWIIEGVAVSRALRKWRDQHPDQAPPVDRLIYLVEPHTGTTPAQRAMAKGVRTVHDEIEGWLARHGVLTEYR